MKIFYGLTVVNGIVHSTVSVVNACDLNIDPLLICGKIIVIQSSTSPFMVLWLKKASGLVIEQGGINCHAAIFARELNIPRIVGVSNCYDKSFNGKMGLINGNRFIVEMEDEHIR